MIRYSFYTATEFINFLEQNKKFFEGRTLKGVLNDFGDSHIHFREDLFDTPVIFVIDNIYVAIEYFIPSYITIYAGTFDEFCDYNKFDKILGYVSDDIDDEITGFMDHLSKKDIKNRKIISVDVKRFSESFCIDAANDISRPDGGDYFSTITMTLDNGVKISGCGSDAMCDGYMMLWAE